MPKLLVPWERSPRGIEQGTHCGAKTCYLAWYSELKEEWRGESWSREVPLLGIQSRIPWKTLGGDQWISMWTAMNYWGWGAQNGVCSSIARPTVIVLY